jgi:hypothetical protein
MYTLNLYLIFTDLVQAPHSTVEKSSCKLLIMFQIKSAEGWPIKFGDGCVLLRELNFDIGK